MEDCKSENDISVLAESLFITEKDGRTRLEFPILFMALIIGMLVATTYHFMFRSKKND